MNSKISIVDLEVFYRVGVPEAERASAQRLLVSLELETNFEAAGKSDSIHDTIDYYAVCQRLTGFGAGRSWRLIETLALELADMVLGEFKPLAVTVEVKKFIIPETRYVSVTVRRLRG